MHELVARAGPLSDWFLEGLRRSAGAGAPTLSQVRARVVAWREHVSEGLLGARFLEVPLDWDEEADTETFPLSARDLQALKLLLVYRDAERPAPELLPDQPERDGVWAEAAGSEFENALYGELLAPGIWFPGRHSFNFVCPLPDGRELEAGFTSALSEQCLAVTEKVLTGTPFEWTLWRSPDDHERSLVIRARAAVAALGEAARSAEDRHLPLFLVPAG